MLPVALLVVLLAAVPTLGSVAAAFAIWRKRRGRPSVRMLYTIATIVVCLFLCQLGVWNVLGWNY